MEHHGEMAFDPIDQFEKVLIPIPLRDDAVQHLPDHEGAIRAPDAEVRHQFCRTVVRPFQQLPVVVPACGQDIEVPPQTLQAVRSCSRHRQPAALRERCCLQSQAEPPEIILCAPIQRVLLAKPHGGVELFGTHAASVVLDEDAALPAVPGERQVDRLRAGGDAVVDDVRQCGSGAVAQTSQGFHHRRSPWRCMTELGFVHDIC